MTGRLEIEPFARSSALWSSKGEHEKGHVACAGIILHSPLAALRSSERSTPNALVLFNLQEYACLLQKCSAE